MPLSLIAMALIIYTWGIFLNTEGERQHKISYSMFMEQLEASNIQSVTISDHHLRGILRSSLETITPDGRYNMTITHFSTSLPSFQGGELMILLKDKNVEINIESEEQLSPFWQFVMGLLPWVLIIGIWIFIMRGAQKVQGGPGGLFSFGQSKAKLHNVERPQKTFSDVAGLANAKKDLQETIDFLKDPTRFNALGANVPKGVLLIGPPGTGKTLIARAVAGEAGVPFYSISASEFIEMFVGVGASRVRDMFSKAKASSPSIIFIDEIDSVGRTRGAGLGGGNDEREQTLNQLLSELDGFERNDEVIVIAATNRPDVLDPALLRPGRFDRHIVIDRPGVNDRKAILLVHMKDKVISDSIDSMEIAKGTPGMSGAELENLVNESTLIAIRNNRKQVEMSDFEEARDKILMGSVREDSVSDLEKRITAYHEAGHALAAHLLPGTDPLHKVSIIPRGMAMGVTQQLPEEDRHYYPKTYLNNRLTVALAGRVAERITFDDLSTGAQSDLQMATSLAEKMVAQWGMSDKVGPVSLGRGEEHPFLGRELSAPKHYSEDMAWLMDQEIRRIIIEAEQRAEILLNENQDKLEALAVALLKDEVLDKTDIERILAEK
ncbi:MAG: ATP-dependent zinc metalloprotease FtsH [Nitrospira sp.]|nr:ATP-dependent zinc metalloprotease FtsH [Nitrospira sp.]